MTPPTPTPPPSGETTTDLTDHLAAALGATVDRTPRKHPNAPCHWWPNLTPEDANEHEIEAVRLAELTAELAVMRSKADNCWGAASYRLKYLACLFRALGMPDDETIESNVSKAAEAIATLRTDLAKAGSEVAELRRLNESYRAATEVAASYSRMLAAQEDISRGLNADLAKAREECERLKHLHTEAMREVATLRTRCDALEKDRARLAEAVIAGRKSLNEASRKYQDGFDNVPFCELAGAMETLLAAMTAPAGNKSP